jgi:hypothetical protein
MPRASLKLSGESHGRHEHDHKCLIFAWPLPNRLVRSAFDIINLAPAAACIAFACKDSGSLWPLLLQLMTAFAGQPVSRSICQVSKVVQQSRGGKLFL